MTPANIPDCSKYVASLIGKNWAPRATGPYEYDCYGLAQEVQKTVFDRDLPSLPEGIDPRSARDVVGAIQVSVLQRTWRRVDQPRHGDLVLMARRTQPAHIGVWIEAGGQSGCLHAECDCGVVFQGRAELNSDWANIEYRRYSGTVIEKLDQLTVKRSDSAVIAVVNDQFNPCSNTDFQEVQPGTKIADAIKDLALDHAYWACLNTTPLLRQNPETKENEYDWALSSGDVLWVLPCVPEGGGGGDGGGSATLATIAAVAIAVAAPYMVGAMGVGSLGLSAGSLTLAGNLVAAGIAIGGALLVGQLVPKPKIAAPLASPEPTYSFGTLSNQVRVGAQIPRIYGTVRRTPDLLSAPWAYYDVDGYQHLQVLLCLGIGDYRLNEFGIGDTVVWTDADGLSDTFADIEFEYLHPGDPLTLFAPAVETSGEVDGITLPEPDGDPVEEQTIGPYTAVARGRTATRLLVDLLFPQGLFDTNGDGDIINETVSVRIEARIIDEDGQPLGDWEALELIQFTDNTNSAILTTKQYDVLPGRYEVQITRTTVSGVSGSVGADTVVWGALRAELEADDHFDDVSALAITLRADETSSGAALTWYADATAILPYIGAQGLIVTGPTEAIDAAVLDVIRAEYGLNMDDARIDFAALGRLAEIWEARGDVCCSSVEASQGAWDLLEDVLTAGRARPQFVGNMITFVRDEQITIPSRLITQADMVRGSFSVERIHYTRTSPNAVKMSYRNRAGQLATVDCVPDGVSTERFAEVTTQYIVDEAQARREGLYLAAANSKRRRYVTFTMLEAGRALLRGQLIEVSHPRPNYGIPARLVDTNWPELILSRPHGFDPRTACFVALQRPDGSYWGPCAATAGPDNLVTLDAVDLDALTAQNDAGYSGDPQVWLATEQSSTSEPTRVAIGDDDHAPLWCKIVEVIPRPNGQVDVVAIEENSEVHSADGLG